MARAEGGSQTCPSSLYLIMQAYDSQSWLKRKLPVTLQEQIELVVLEARLQGIKKVAGGAEQKRAEHSDRVGRKRKDRDGTWKATG